MPEPTPQFHAEYPAAEITKLCSTLKLNLCNNLRCKYSTYDLSTLCIGAWVGRSLKCYHGRGKLTKYECNLYSKDPSISSWGDPSGSTGRAVGDENLRYWDQSPGWVVN